MTLILKHVDKLRRNSINGIEKLRDVEYSDLLLSLILVSSTTLQVANLQRMNQNSHSPRVVVDITILSPLTPWTAVMP